jgi:amidohydrolase
LKLLEKIQSLNHQFFAKIQSYRHHLHKHPELSWEEYNTTNFIIGFLKEQNIPYSQISKTGVVAILAGKNPTSKCIALRADIDALPITESNEIEYKSENIGCMHACGHDVHTASLMGAALILNELKSDWEGTIKLLFQPSEEMQPSGAKTMIEAGVLEGVDFIIGQHVTPELEAGKIGFRSGPFMASADELYIKIIGKGGHGATPEKCINPIPIAAELIIALYLMIEEVKSEEPLLVMSIGNIIGEGATNIIPDTVNIKGTIRTFNESIREKIHSKIKFISSYIAQKTNSTIEVIIPEGLPFVLNDKKLTNQLKNATISYLGSTNVVEMPIRMGAEDFAFYSHTIPGCFYRLGTGNVSKNATSNIHTSTFDIDEDVLKHSSGVMAWMAINI